MKIPMFERVGTPVYLLSLPSPPTNNRYYRRIVMGKRAVTLLSSDARKFKNAVADYCAVHGIKPIDGNLFVQIDWYRPRKVGDSDAPVKGVFDALQGFAYHNDKQIAEHYVRKLDDKNRPRVEVAVCVLRSEAK